MCDEDHERVGGCDERSKRRRGGRKCDGVMKSAESSKPETTFSAKKTSDDTEPAKASGIDRRQFGESKRVVA
jgi:hypothetical protein